MDFKKTQDLIRMLKLSGREDLEASKVKQISDNELAMTEADLALIPYQYRTVINEKVHVMDLENNKLVLKPVKLDFEDTNPPKTNKLKDYEKDGGDNKKVNKNMVDNENLSEEILEILENFIANDSTGRRTPYTDEQIKKAEEFLRNRNSKLANAKAKSSLSRKEKEDEELKRSSDRKSREVNMNRHIKSNLALRTEDVEDAIAFSKDEFSDEEREEYHGLDDVRSVTVKIPRNITTDINKRISEIEKSIEAYDEKGYNDGAGANSNKNKAIEALEQIKANLASRDYEGFKEAQLFYLTLMSPITDLFPASVVNFLANGEDVNVVGSNTSSEVKPHETDLKESNNIDNVREDKRFRVTYQIVSPESAEMGDSEDQGWVDEEGISMTPDAHDVEDGVTAVDNAVEFLKNRGAVNPSVSPTYTGGDVWFSDNGDTDYQTGNEKTLSYHPLGFSEEELKEIYDRVTGKSPVSEASEFESAKPYVSLEDVYPKGQTEVWYMKPEFFRDGTMGFKFLQKQDRVPNANDLDKTHVLIGKLAETNPEKVYVMMQGENWSPGGEARALIRSRGVKHTSMTTGDIVVVNGKALLVDNFGFTPLSEKTNNIDNPTMESLINESYMYTRKEKFDRHYKNNILPNTIKSYGAGDKAAIRTAYNDYIDSLVKDGALPPAAMDWTVPDSFFNVKEKKVSESISLKDLMLESRKKKKKMENPCWKGYEPVGTKKGKDGKEVPNCVPKDKD